MAAETSYLLSGGSYYENSEDFTHYFELGDVNYCDRIGNGYWRQINKDERICKVLDAIVDNYEGNNPHSGNYQYDNGKEKQVLRTRMRCSRDACRSRYLPIHRRRSDSFSWI